MWNFNYNMDIKTRDEIIFGEYNPNTYSGGVRYFYGMNLDTLNKLIELGFVDLDEAQNNSPTIDEFIEWMENHDGYIVNGYVVSDKREDYRLSIVSIKKTEKIEDKDELVEFIEAFRNADVFDIDGYAWWD